MRQAMLGQVKKLIPPIAAGDLAGRLGAWWDGRAYAPASSNSNDPDDPDAVKAPPAPSSSEEPEASSGPSKPAKPPKALKAPKASKSARSKERTKGGSPTEAAGAVASEGGPDSSGPRLRALSAMWGEGRYGPGSLTLDSYLLDAIEGAPDKAGAVGFIGADPALIAECRDRFGRPIIASEWRPGCLEPLKTAVPEVEAMAGDIDRPKAFPEGGMGVVLSCDAFAYSDHKAGLISRVYRALSESGRWVVVDISRTTARTPPEAFASAWAEPQTVMASEIEEMLRHAGFRSVRRAVVSDRILATVKGAFVQIPARLEQAAIAMREGREGAMFLQELTWELTSWQARKKALEGGALVVDLWIAEKAEPAASAPRPATASVEVGPDGEGLAEAIMAAIDQGSIDNLFE
ncbi:MAG: hypothetical protein KGS00_09570 [Alphaproteobacteria bacterium]|nr:hypothetical protein [Alphaproteobacteria bacterium]